MSYSSLNCPAVSQLLTQVQTDFGIQESLTAKYFGAPSAPLSVLPVPVVAPPAPVTEKKKRQIKEKPADQLCQAVTTKGQCRFVAKCEGLCGIHLRKKNKDAEAGPSEPKVAKKPKVVKKKPEAPKHTHPLTEEAEDCQVCETQGNVITPELTKAEFEAVAEDGLSIQARLKAILANSDNDDSDEEVEEAPKPEPVVEVPKPVVEVPKPVVEVPKPVVEVEVPKPMETEEEEEEEEEEYDEEEEMTISLRAKLAKLVADEDDEDEEDVDISQLVETPPSRDRLDELMGKLSVKEGKETGFDFEALEAEMEI
jgi:hypothetical protein